MSSNIPKQIFFYWGNETMCYMRYQTLVTFRAHNPDWKIILVKNHDAVRPRWRTHEKLEKYTYSGPDYSDRLSALNIEILNFDYGWVGHIDPQMSDTHCKDISNWYLLSMYGGVVADMDILWIKSMTQVSGWGDVCLVCFGDLPLQGYIPVTFMMGTANHFFRDMHRRSLANYNPEIYESCGAMLMPYRSIANLQDEYPTLRINRLNDYVVFPWAGFKQYQAVANALVNDQRESIPKESIGIHWYGGGDSAQKIIRRVTEENIRNFDGTIFKLAMEYAQKSTA